MRPQKEKGPTVKPGRVAENFPTTYAAICETPKSKPSQEVSHVEKQNHTLRMHCRRLTRLTNAFSKKLENFEAAVALNFAYYNFCRAHIAIRRTRLKKLAS